MDKKARFLSAENTAIIIKRFYQAHTNDGGDLPVETFREQIPELMDKWRGTAILNSYESIGVDPLVEIERAGDDFFQTYWPMFAVGDDFKRLPKLLTPDDYRNMDTVHRKDVNVEAGMYRYDNTIPKYQWVPARHYDQASSASGLRGRSIPQGNREFGDMADVMAEVDRPYKKVDTLDAPYYGQAPDDSTTRLTATLWKTG